MQTVDAGDLSIGDGHPPRIMGVLNVSEESPYDPSVFSDPEAAAQYVDRELIEQGADIVDVGLESANKRFEVLSAVEERERLHVACETIDLVDGEAIFSIETRYSEVADAALDSGFDMVNDVCGFADPEMADVCRAHDAAVVKMASPPDLSRPGALSDVEEIYDALERGGLTEKTIVDPAFGGWTEEKTLADDRETFRRLREFRALDRPILVSINRKNFLGDLVGRETDDRLPASLAATAMAVERGAHVIRTHDVAETVDAATIGWAFARDRLRTERIEELDVTTDGELQRHLDRFDSTSSISGTGITRTYLLALDDDERSALLRASEDVPTVSIATARNETLLVGSKSGITRVRERVGDESPSLRELLASIIGDHM